MVESLPEACGELEGGGFGAQSSGTAAETGVLLVTFTNEPVSVLEEEGSVVVPGFRAGGLERGQARQRDGDITTFANAPRGLQTGTQERVRGGSEPDPRGVGGLHQAKAALAVQRERFLRPHVLSGIDGGGATSTCAAGMLRWPGSVWHK